MTLKFELPNTNPNTKENSEEAFQPDGKWEKNGGRIQTRNFAKCFHKHVSIPANRPFRVLDVGCALGDSMPIWHSIYPRAEIWGTDVSSVAITRATQKFGNIAKFFRASFEEIEGQFDVIFCSNVMEHFEQHVEIAEELLKHCSFLYIMTPYAEAKNGRNLVPEPGQFHVATFLEDTFDRLRTDNVFVRTWIVRCPGAWSPSIWSELLWHFNYMRGRNSNTPPPRRQIIYEISKTA